MWVGLFAAPIGWATSHVIGWGVGEANCEAAGRQWGISFVAWEWALLVVAAGLAVLGVAASMATYRAIRGTEKDDPPPDGRTWVLSISGMVVSSLLLVAILLTHIGALLLSGCHQG
jgi:hypothetical protein